MTILIFNSRDSVWSISGVTFYCCFFFSGFAALIYQVSWQRELFRIYGVNIESVTVIVSVFIFGLGIGSLIGGLVSSKLDKHLPLAFAVCECGIGLFGVFSLPIFRWFSAETIFYSLGTIALYNFLLLLFPTCLMGATLPLLVEFFERFELRVGSIVSSLYYVNTLGSGIASILVVVLFYQILGLQSTIYLAAALNFIVAFLVMLLANKHVDVESEAAG